MLVMFPCAQIQIPVCVSFLKGIKTLTGCQLEAALVPARSFHTEVCYVFDFVVLFPELCSGAGCRVE